MVWKPRFEVSCSGVAYRLNEQPLLHYVGLLRLAILKLLLQALTFMLILVEGIYLATKLLKVLLYSACTRGSAMRRIRRWILRGRKRRYLVFRRSVYLDVVTEREAFSLGACSQIGSPLEKG
jgi:hypothetical protein